MSEDSINCDSLRYVGCGALFTVDPATKKWGLTALSIGVIVVGILGVVYGGCGLTSLAESNYLFTPLQSLSTAQIHVVIVSGVGLSVIGVVFIYPLHSPTFILPKVLETLNEIELDSKHFEKVKENLVYGCQERYDFYYHLASITEEMSADPEQKQKWLSFLNEIHGKRLQCRGGGSITVDCTYEFLRMEGVIPQLEVERIKKFSTQDRTDILALCACAFESFDNYNPEYFDQYFCRQNEYSYVVRQQDNRKLMGIIILEEVKTADRGVYLKIHTLARQPNAVKLGITNKFKESVLPFVVGKYPVVFCDVLKDNLTARRLYEGLGFRPVWASFFEDHLTMSLTDPSVLKKASTVCTVS